MHGAELLEILPEHLGELSGLRIKRGRIRPRLSRVQHPGWDSFDLSRNRETKDRIGHRPHVVQLAGERRTRYRPGVRQFYALPLSIRTAAPTCVDEPHVRFVLLEQVAEHFCVLRRMPDEKSRAETCAERWLRLLDAALGAGNLRRIPGKEIVHRLLGGELGDW